MDARTLKRLLAIVDYAKQQVQSSGGEIQVLEDAVGEQQFAALDLLEDNLQYDYAVTQIAAFTKHLNRCLEVSNQSEAAEQNFRDMTFKITFGGFELELPNCAQVFNGILEVCDSFED
jgi:hypothetical protein